MATKFKCIYWNIHGISSKVFGDKTKDPKLLEIVSDYDIVCFSELHTDKNISIPGFKLKKQKFRPRTHKGPKISGGLAVFIKHNIEKNFTVMHNTNVDSIWIKNNIQQLHLGFYYCSPENIKSKFFETVNNEIGTMCNETNTYIFGDFNARTKVCCENIIADKFDEELGISSDMYDSPYSRNSEDLKIVNKRGKDFLKICRINNFCIANGRVLGDLFGKYTCHQKKARA